MTKVLAWATIVLAVLIVTGGLLISVSAARRGDYLLMVAAWPMQIVISAAAYLAIRWLRANREPPPGRPARSPGEWSNE